MRPEQKGAVKTKSIYKPKERGDGTRILITRFYSRGVRKTHFDRWARELAPSASLLKRYRDQETTWEEFAASYKTEMQENEESLQTIQHIYQRF